MTADAERGSRQNRIAEVITEYSAVKRLPTSPGEQAVAASLVARFTALGLPARLETVTATSSYAVPIGLLSAIDEVVVLEQGEWPDYGKARAAYADFELTAGRDWSANPNRGVQSGVRDQRSPAPARRSS